MSKIIGQLNHRISYNDLINHHYQLFHILKKKRATQDSNLESHAP